MVDARPYSCQNRLTQQLMAQMERKGNCSSPYFYQYVGGRVADRNVENDEHWWLQVCADLNMADVWMNSLAPLIVTPMIHSAPRPEPHVAYSSYRSCLTMSTDGRISLYRVVYSPGCKHMSLAHMSTMSYRVRQKPGNQHIHIKLVTFAHLPDSYKIRPFIYRPLCSVAYDRFRCRATTHCFEE